ncbi:hypothetical protein L3Y34_011561 [Caenorhabditis briggsae]|uniref:Uncharacterized protein n=1 Tax=Caenorhabditis briggsae TaxID=6238 RepID=A0AAE9CV71_CAEBR|nr:hypothetical protein L3Y34_011561 [Caenorhabditis briggsae]
MDFLYFDSSNCTCSGMINFILVSLFSVVFASLVMYYILMNFRHDRRIKQLLEKKTLKSLFKIFLQRVYENNELQQMERELHFMLDFKKEDTPFKKLLENDEDESGPISNECLDSLYKKSSGKDHSLENMLTL